LFWLRLRLDLEAVGVLGWNRDRNAVLILSQTATGTKDRAPYQGAVDHVDSAQVRSAVGLMVGANWVMDVVDAIGGCWDGDPDRCTYPTAYDPRTISVTR
jgi:hypothetical protein